MQLVTLPPRRLPSPPAQAPLGNTSREGGGCTQGHSFRTPLSAENCKQWVSYRSRSSI